MNEKQRQVFEVWCHNNPLKTDKRPNGDYKYTSTDLAWQAWQAAIASVVVELPELNVDGIDASEFFDDVKSALDNAGVRYE